MGEYGAAKHIIWQGGTAGCWRPARIRAVMARTASGSSRVAPWPTATEALLSLSS
jgi:hypothetical protein